MTKNDEASDISPPASRLIICPSVVCSRNTVPVFLYHVTPNAVGDQLFACGSCGYETVCRKGSGQFEPRPGCPAQGWRPPQRLDERNSNPDTAPKEVDSENRCLGAQRQGSRPVQLTITTNSGEEIETMNSQKMDVPNGEADASVKDASGGSRERAASRTARRLSVKTVSIKKLEANRRNALRSTGPTSQEGKARIARNALKHGVLSRDTLLPNEDREAFEELVEALWADWQPVGAQEEVLVEQVVRETWRLRRLGLAETGVFALEGRFASGDAGLILSLGVAFTRNSRRSIVFPTLSRYEAGIERSYYRALHELQRLQHARLVGQTQPPLAVDVNLTGGSSDSPAR
jgi:hypothetical protein